MAKEKKINKEFPEEVLTRIINCHVTDFYKFINKTMSYKECKMFVQKFVAELYRCPVEFSSFNDEFGKVTNAAYSPFEDNIIINDETMENLYQSGDLTSLLILIFHEGTHKYQYVENPFNFNEIRDDIYSERQLEIILSMLSPNYNNMSKNPEYIRNLQYASYLTYLDIPKEKEAREMAYKNTQSLYKQLAKMIDSKFVGTQIDNNAIATFNDEYALDVMSSYAQDALTKIDDINLKYDNYDNVNKRARYILDEVSNCFENINLDDLFDSLVESKLFSLNFPNADFHFKDRKSKKLSDEQKENLEYNQKLILGFLEKKVSGSSNILKVNEQHKELLETYKLVLSGLNDEQLLNLYSKFKNMPQILKMDQDIYFALKSEEARKQLRYEIVKNGDINTIEHLFISNKDAVMDDREIEDLFKLSIDKGMYSTSDYLYDIVISKIGILKDKKEAGTFDKNDQTEAKKLSNLLDTCNKYVYNAMVRETKDGMLNPGWVKDEFDQELNSLESLINISLNFEKDEKKNELKKEWLERLARSKSEALFKNDIERKYGIGDFAPGRMSVEEVAKLYDVKENKSFEVISMFFLFLNDVSSKKFTLEELESHYQMCVNNVMKDGQTRGI